MKLLVIVAVLVFLWSTLVTACIVSTQEPVRRIDCGTDAPRQQRVVAAMDL